MASPNNTAFQEHSQHVNASAYDSLERGRLDNEVTETSQQRLSGQVARLWIAVVSLWIAMVSLVSSSFQLFARVPSQSTSGEMSFAENTSRQEMVNHEESSFPDESQATPGPILNRMKEFATKLAGISVAGTYTVSQLTIRNTLTKIIYHACNVSFALSVFFTGAVLLTIHFSTPKSESKIVRLLRYALRVAIFFEGMGYGLIVTFISLR